MPRHGTVRAALLALATAVVWLVGARLWDAGAWLAPPNYRIDSLEVLARVHLAADQGTSLLLDKTMARLGAPFGADWSAYPMPDLPIFLLLGAIDRLVGIPATGHIAMLIADLLNALVFYACSRALGHRWQFAAGASLLFAFSRFNVGRGLSHYSLTLSFTVPAILLAAWLIGGSRHLLTRRRWQWACFLVAIATAMGTPYYGLMFGCLVLFAIGYALVKGLGRTNVLVGVASLFVFGAMFFALHWESILAILADHNVLVRTYGDTERLALRPFEILLPQPGHRITALTKLTNVYTGAMPAKGENYTSYFGVVGLAALALMLGSYGRALLRGRAGLRPAFVPLTAFAVVLGMAGGCTGLLALTVTDLFRAGNRYIVFVLTATLLYAASWCTRAGRGLSAVAATALTALVVAVGLFDQTDRVPAPGRLPKLAEGPEWDRQLGETLEKKLPPGSMVFQMPVVPFLEQPPLHRMTDYELFRPYLATSTQRFSYGHLASADALTWLRRTEHAPFPVAVQRLQEAGFAAVYVCRAAYADGAMGLRQIAAGANLPVLFDAGPHLVFGLTPSATPKLPALVGADRRPPWDGESWFTDGVVALEDGGWYDVEHHETSVFRWAGERAACVFWNPFPDRRAVKVRCQIESRGAEPISVSLGDGRELWRCKTAIQTVACEFALDLPPGETRVQWRYHGPATRFNATDARPLGLRVTDLQIEVRP